jgi:hypothetical protein
VFVVSPEIERRFAADEALALALGGRSVSVVAA